MKYAKTTIWANPQYQRVTRKVKGMGFRMGGARRGKMLSECMYIGLIFLPTDKTALANTIKQFKLSKFPWFKLLSEIKQKFKILFPVKFGWRTKQGYRI